MENKFKPFDSPISMEQWFDFWCEDLIKAGYIKAVYRKLKPHILTEVVYAEYEEIKILYKGTKREREKRTIKKKIVLKESSYTPDRLIKWTDKSLNIFFTPLNLPTDKLPLKNTYFYANKNPEGWASPVDVKAPAGYGNTNCSDATFSIVRKYIFYRYNMFINKVMNYPNSLTTGKKPRFKNPEPYLWMSTFTPSRYFHTDKLTKLRVISKWEPRTLEQFIKEKTSTVK